MLKTTLTFYFSVLIFFSAMAHSENGLHGLDKKIPGKYPGLSKSSLNKKSLRYVKNYIKKSRRSLVIIKHRSSIPFNIIDSVFRHYGLPPELKYLAVIESELKPSALSTVGAKGPWQLMPQTAHIFGLKTTRGNDERTNYYKSTQAAARYLRDLYTLFGDWYLVIAAYNGGPAPVHFAIRKSGSKNFWALQNYLPAESRGHVKKFIATRYYFETQGSPASSFAVLNPGTALVPTAIVPVNESSKEKFARLMRTSGESLQKSDSLLNRH